MTTWRPRVSRRRVQVLLGALWVFDGALQFQPFMYRHEFVTRVLVPNAAGQPAPVARSITWAAGVVSHHLIFGHAARASDGHGALIAIALAVVSAVIGVGS